MEQVYFSNIVTNEDGTINFSEEVKKEGEVVGSSEQTNIIINPELSLEDNLKARCFSSIEVFVDGVSVGNGTVE